MMTNFRLQKCEKCDAYTPCVKQLRIATPPKILVIQLKRFDYMKQEKVRIYQCVLTVIQRVMVLADFDARSISCEGTRYIRVFDTARWVPGTPVLSL
jgi:ubiquitin C-terminal hydrolase